MRTLMHRILVPLAAAAALAGCDDERNSVALPTAPTMAPANALTTYMTISDPGAGVGEPLTVTVRAVRGSGIREIGSFTMTVAYDSTALEIVDVPRSAHGMVLANTETAGSIRVAGAAGDGFTDDVLLTVTFRVTDSFPTRGLSLDVTELNSVGFLDSRSALRVDQSLYRALEK